MAILIELEMNYLLYYVRIVICLPWVLVLLSLHWNKYAGVLDAHNMWASGYGGLPSMTPMTVQKRSPLDMHSARRPVVNDYQSDYLSQHQRGPYDTVVADKEICSHGGRVQDLNIKDVEIQFRKIQWMIQVNAI